MVKFTLINIAAAYSKYGESHFRNLLANWAMINEVILRIKAGGPTGCDS